MQIVGWNTEICIANRELATTAKILCVIFFAWRREEMANVEGGPIKGNLWNQG